MEWVGRSSITQLTAETDGGVMRWPKTEGKLPRDL